MNSSILKFGKFFEFYNFQNQQIYNKNSNLENQNLAPKIDKFWNCSSTRHFTLHTRNSAIFTLSFKSNLTFVTYQFLFPILVTRKFGRSTFESSLIFKFKTSAILKFCCLKFQPSS